MNNKAGLILLGIAGLLLGACVIPYTGGEIKMLTVTPNQFVYPRYYAFDYTEELVVTFTDGWDVKTIPPQYTDLEFDDDFATVGEKKGICQYRGKTAAFSVYVYDPEAPEGGSGGFGGDGPHIIIIPKG